MEVWLLAVLGAVLTCFAGVLLAGAPYLPTLQPQIKAGFELLKLRRGQTVLELGCGDGKVLVYAARLGYNAVGIELNPILCAVARLRTWRYRDRVTIICGNMWRVPWPEADGVYTFLLDRFMPRLDHRMQQYGRPLVSVAFQVPGRKPVDEKRGVFLYEYRY